MNLCRETASDSSIVLRSRDHLQLCGAGVLLSSQTWSPPSMDHPTSGPPHRMLHAKLRSYGDKSGHVSQRQHSCEGHGLLGSQRAPTEPLLKPKDPARAPQRPLSLGQEMQAQQCSPTPVPLPQPSGRKFKSGGAALNDFLHSVYSCACIALTLVSDKRSHGCLH